jgi:hypothetical protein
LVQLRRFKDSFERNFVLWSLTYGIIVVENWKNPSSVRLLDNFWTLASTELYNSALKRSWREEVCNAKEHAEKWTGKEMAAQNVEHLDNCEIFNKKSVSSCNNFWFLAFYEPCNGALERSWKVDAQGLVLGQFSGTQVPSTRHHRW